MNLKTFCDQNHAPIPLGILAMDDELIRDIQGQLMLVGLLDPPVDGKFGPVSRWALTAFCERTQVSLAGGFTKQIAAALLDGPVNDVFPLNPGSDFAGRVIKAMQKGLYWINRHPDCCNIVYIEGCNTDGTANANNPNQFNDVRLLITVGINSVPKLVHVWDGTTEPGRVWTMNPMDPHGAARIAFGQYKSWAVGIHHAGQSSAHEALVQVDDVTVYRDLNKDFRRVGDRTYTGVFAINQHWGYNLLQNDLGNSSAGCLVGRTKDGHKEFMSLVKKDPRHLASTAYRFVSTILPFSDL